MPVQLVGMASASHGYLGLGLYRSGASRRTTLEPPPPKTRVKKDQWDAAGIHVVVISLYLVSLFLTVFLFFHPPPLLVFLSLYFTFTVE